MCIFCFPRLQVDALELVVRDKASNLARLTAQRNELNGRVRLLREELFALQEVCCTHALPRVFSPAITPVRPLPRRGCAQPGSHVGEVVKAMGKTKVLVKVNPEGKYVVDLDKDIDINKCKPNQRVALRSDSYTLHKILPTKVDPMVQLMKVEKVPDSTYDMVGGLGKQIREIKEVRNCRLCQRNCQLIYMAVRSPPSLLPYLPSSFRTPGHRTAHQAPRAFRIPRRSAAQGRPPLWTTWDGQNLACTCRCAPHRLHLRPRLGCRTGAKVYWRGNCFSLPISLEPTLSSTQSTTSLTLEYNKIASTGFENGTRTFCYGARGRAVDYFHG